MMKYCMYMRNIVVVLVAVLLCGVGVVDAQQNERTSSVKIEPPKKSKSSSSEKPKRDKPLVQTEFGLGVGLQYPWMKVMKPDDMTAVFAPRLGFGAALQFRIGIGKVFGIQPEVTYSYSTIKIEDTQHDLKVKARSNLVQMPILLSIRAAMFRFNAGPVITLMDNPYYTISGDKAYMGRIYPTVTYAAGVSVKFAKCMMIDLRYAGQFKDIRAHNEYIWTFDETQQPEAMKFRTRNSSIQFRFGYVF